MKYNYIRAIAGFLLIGMSWYMVYANKDMWGWPLFAALVLLLSTITSKEDTLGWWNTDEEEEDTDER
ncbi:MAG TPA: hypothetical protein VK890_00210 [Bacteroidia bacterium]|jgi:hypothetical protein|nr:hypothetical protein [Bacteroidia bacterium]